MVFLNFRPISFYHYPLQKFLYDSEFYCTVEKTLFIKKTIQLKKKSFEWSLLEIKKNVMRALN